MMPRRAIATFALSVLAAFAGAQATVSHFGQGCMPGNAIGAANLPRIGQTFQVTYSGIYGSVFIGWRAQLSAPMLILGLSNTMAGGVPLPALLPAALTGGATNCQVLASPDTITPLSLAINAPPPWTLPLPIPASSSMVGLTFYLQWLTVIQTTQPLAPTTWSMVTTDALRAVIGN